jgi:thiol-disulfide isomerase/thioredoxin
MAYVSRLSTPRPGIRHAALVMATLAVAALAAAGCASGGQPAQAGPGSGGQAGTVGTTSFPAAHRPAAPEVSGATLTGAHLRLSAYRGRIVVLNFWASWCELCRAEAPVLARLSRGYQARGVQFIGVDINDTRASAQAFERRYGIGYPSLSDPSARLELAFGRLIPPAIPDTLVLDRTGHLEARVIGKVTYPGLKHLLDQALGTVS